MLYWIAIVILKSLRIILWPFVRITIIGSDNVPRKGAVALASKHISGLDIPIISLCLWRQVHFMAKAELFQIPIVGWWMEAVGSFAVARGKADRQALRKGVEIISDGDVLAVFPEGTRKNKPDEIGEINEGLAYMVNHAKVKPFIIPVAVCYGKGIPKGITVVFGEPVSCATNDRKQLTDNIRVGMEHVLSDAYKVSEEYVME